MSDLTFRTATPDDAAVVRAFVDSLEEHVSARDLIATDLDVIQSDMAEPDPCFRAELLERDSIPVAMVSWYPIYSTWLWRRGIYALDVFVSEQERGQGHARRLLTHLAAMAREMGGAFLKLDVDRTNDDAAAVYVKLGFTPSESDPYLLIGDAFDTLAAQA